MIDYPFRDLDSGKQVTVRYEMGEGPEIGEVIERRGRRLQRLSVADSEQAFQAPRVGWVDKPIVSHTLHRWHAEAKHFDSRGRPILPSRGAYKELVKRHNGNENAVLDLHIDD
jgi:hypothetical protein